MIETDHNEHGHSDADVHDTAYGSHRTQWAVVLLLVLVWAWTRRSRGGRL